jgi:ferredoxin, 2Fe-2S
VRINVLSTDGAMRTVDAAAGISLMANLRDAGVDEIAAICGGGCACATCHVYVDEAFLSGCGEVGEDEDELLDTVDGRRHNSRLSCQVECSTELDGMIVILPLTD